MGADKFDQLWSADALSASGVINRQRSVVAPDERWTTSGGVQDNEAVTPTPVWFGPPERRLFGWLHRPDQAVTGVVLCLPLGDESFPAYRAYRLLAEQLEAAGVATLRFDYSGTGDSALAVASVTEVSVWTADVERAVSAMRGVGVRRVALVGMRAGALLVAQVAAKAQVEGVVLWDPCENGRRFLREQWLVLGTGATSVAEASDEGRLAQVAIQGLELPPGLARSLAAIDLADAIAGVRCPVLVVARPERPMPPPLHSVLVDLGAARITAPEQERFFDVDVWHSYRAEQVVDEVASWCLKALAGRRLDSSAAELFSGVELTTEAHRPAVVARDAAGRAVTERVVYFGVGGLVGIVTELEGTDPVSSPGVILLNMGLDRHIGPSRLWVDLSRRWAEKGCRALRFDLTGIGDSPVPPGRVEHPYPPEAISDGIAAAHFLLPDDPASAVLVGACSGGYHANEVAAALGAREAWLINPAVPRDDIMHAIDDGIAKPVAGDTERRTVRHVAPIGRALLGSPVAVRLAHRLVPRSGWWLLDKAGLYAHPARAFRALIDGGTHVRIICGTAESQYLISRSHAEIQRLERTGRFDLNVVDFLDHTLLQARSRTAAASILDGYLADVAPDEITSAVAP